MNPAESRALDTSPNYSNRFRRRSLARFGCGLAAFSVVALLFYAFVGYLGSADMFGDHPRWRGMNRSNKQGSTDFCSHSE